ncbi:hypothetical protein K437DRAFT_145371 [Tilletiaria anomala UBC 951]|uniref:DNA replication regulator Sld3 C-terminal domain-containing protein n=1 Tax=Tilletiaria anomala (strain ATCC 24038 / CBS 436.72 / UBC 951) TaxID=1037660 RepID=A0A066VR51_TILAU|nr:uncharacterized protein K437DRAFT_145371 [Tilletiaria anomala UBC 951]KDN43921.1 hypothetical protein K437DRAFT_145371 [Tilletiaria anomala UBC 951]
MKLFFLLWMLAARDQAACRLFASFLHPLIRPYEPVFDLAFASCRDAGSLIRFVSTLSLSRVFAALESLWSAFSKHSNNPVGVKVHQAGPAAKVKSRLIPPPASTRRSPVSSGQRGSTSGPGGGESGLAASSRPNHAEKSLRPSSSQSLRAVQAGGSVVPHPRLLSSAHLAHMPLQQDDRTKYAQLQGLPAPPSVIKAPAAQGSSPSPLGLRNYAFIPPVSIPRHEGPIANDVKLSTAKSVRTATKPNAVQVLAQHSLVSRGGSEMDYAQVDTSTSVDPLSSIWSPHMPGFLKKTPTAPSVLRQHNSAERVHQDAEGDEEDLEGRKSVAPEAEMYLATIHMDDTFAHTTVRKRSRVSSQYTSKVKRVASSNKKRKGHPTPPEDNAAPAAVDVHGYITVSESDATASTSEETSTRQPARSKKGRKTNSAADAASSSKKRGGATGKSRAEAKSVAGGDFNSKEAEESTPRAKSNGIFRSTGSSSRQRTTSVTQPHASVGKNGSTVRKTGIRALTFARNRNPSMPALGQAWAAQREEAAQQKDTDVEMTSAGKKESTTRRRKLPSSSSLALAPAAESRAGQHGTTRTLRSSKSMAGL